MENKLTIQAVSGAIRATKGIIASTKYPSGSKRTRSTGIYAEVRRYYKDIKLDFETCGYDHAFKQAQIDMPKVIAALESKGFKVVTKLESFGFGPEDNREVLIVEVP
jgi:hypothetical protein